MSSGSQIAMEPRPAATILIIEDEGAVREYVRFCLEDLGYSVLTASSTAEALALSDDRSRTLDLLITDVRLRSDSGFELAERVMASHRNIGVLFMSGDSILLPSHWEARGAQFLEKPFLPEALRDKVQQMLTAGR